MKIAVIGTGYVGLVSGTCFAETGNEVICIDIDEKKIDKLRNGEITIYEPGLETMFTRNLRQGRLKFTTSLEEGVKDAVIIFLALPTPPGEDGSADLSYVLNVSRDLGKLINSYKVIVDKSTVPVGTSEKVYKEIKQNCSVEFDVVSNPEFLREGYAVADFMKPNRIVIGSDSARAKNLMNSLYKPYVRSGNPIIFMDEKSAEMTKYAANSFLAAKISFMNEVANLCELVGANVDEVRKGMGADERIGKRFLFPGIGYGGSCFPKDVKAMHKTAEDFSYDFKILDAVTHVNDIQKTVIQQKISDYYNENIEGKLFALWGLAFKPNTDDIREAPSIDIINFLLSRGAKIKVYDPEAIGNIRSLYESQLLYATSQYDCFPADALIIATEWSVFRTPDFSRIENSVVDKVIFDGRNLYDKTEFVGSSLNYISIGRSDRLVNNNLPYSEAS